MPLRQRIGGHLASMAISRDHAKQANHRVMMLIVYDIVHAKNNK